MDRGGSIAEIVHRLASASTCPDQSNICGLLLQSPSLADNGVEETAS